ncbi:MAG: glutathione binding-like protein [Erythrobacter sp.]|nr:glutathione binding-like protein [Erythrobacter sp.]
MIDKGRHPVMQIETLEAFLWATPNSRRVSILFEELGLEYRVHPVNIRAREQFAPAILALNPYGKLPIVTWREQGETHVMTESGAILLHFGARDPAIVPPGGAAREAVLVWLMMAMTSLGPMTGNAHHWTSLTPEPSDIAMQHHVALVRRAYAVLEQQLARHDFLAGDAYSLADIAAYPWVAVHDWARVDLAEFPAIARWLEQVGARPAVQRGMLVPHGAVLA